MRDVREIILTTDIDELVYYIDYIQQLIEMCEKRELNCFDLREDKKKLVMRNEELKEYNKYKSEDKLWKNYWA